MEIVHKNKKAYFDYDIKETWIAGIALSGGEIKSVRKGHVNLKGAYITVKNGEAFLKNAQIARYPFDQQKEYDPFQERKLLLKKKEIEKLETGLNEQGITVVPLAFGLMGRYAKVELGLARGKKAHDKRQNIKEKTIKRDTARIIKNWR